MDKKVYAERLSELVLNKGVALEKGDYLNIVVSPDAYFYGRVMAEYAYRMGAKYVNIRVSDMRLDKVRSKLQNREDLSYIPSSFTSYVEEGLKTGIKNVRIDCADERLEDIDFDQDNYQTLNQAFRKAQKELSAKYMGNEIKWCVAVAPGPVWAEKVLGKGKKEEDLADVLASILHIDTPDFLSLWDEEDRVSKKRVDYLNSRRIRKLHFKSPVTDFTVGFRKEAFYEGGSSETVKGSVFWPNLPTAEIFCTPDNSEAEGYITTTKTVNVLGTDTEKVTLTFKGGKCISVKAEKGQEVMEKYLSIDEGSSRLGEVALVDIDSPISRTGLTFGSILIDENASCHIALGQGYSSNLHIGDKDPKDYGCNESLVHTDFMVGSPDMSITALTYDGEEVKIMEDGHFLF